VNYGPHLIHRRHPHLGLEPLGLGYHLASLQHVTREIVATAYTLTDPDRRDTLAVIESDTPFHWETDIDGTVWCCATAPAVCCDYRWGHP